MTYLCSWLMGMFDIAIVGISMFDIAIIIGIETVFIEILNEINKKERIK